MPLLPLTRQMPLPEQNITSKNPNDLVALFKLQKKTWTDRDIEIADVVNKKIDKAEPITITSTPTNIRVIPQRGAFIVTVYGVKDQRPTLIAALVKSDEGVAGTITGVASQTTAIGAWSGVSLVITSTATNFQIAHSGASNLVDDFLVTYIGLT